MASNSTLSKSGVVANDLILASALGFILGSLMGLFLGLMIEDLILAMAVSVPSGTILGLIVGLTEKGNSGKNRQH